MPEIAMHRIMGTMEENLRAREARVTANRLDLIVDTAIDRGMDTALEKYGYNLSGNDKTALKTLSSEDLKSMVQIRDKMANVEALSDVIGVIF